MAMMVTIIIFTFLFQMTPNDEIIRTTQFGGVYFDLKNQYKILLNIVKKNFFRLYDANKNIFIKNWNDCIIFCYKKNLLISFQRGPER